MEEIIKYYAYIKKNIKGPFYPKDIALIPGFTKNTLVCPERALGQWREAYIETAFRYCLEGENAGDNSAPAKKEIYALNETKVIKPVLEKALRQNSLFESEIKKIKREHSEEKSRFAKELERKNNEITNLIEKLKRARLRASIKEEHPSWEVLYKTYKKRAEQKRAEALEKIAELSNEIAKIREDCDSKMAAAKSENKNLQEEFASYAKKTERKISTLESELEEKETILKTYDENMKSVMNRNEEFQRILFEERQDYEDRIKNFCDEVGNLKAEVKWKSKEILTMKTELSQAMEKIQEFESLQAIKTTKQRELYDVIRTKIKILNDYFDNLENKLKYAFKKA